METSPDLLLPLTRTLIMGIVNVTPDSFSDGGRYDAPEAALAHARALVDEGADMLDIGAESTRPGATPVPEADELARALPIVGAVAALGVPVSIDTYKPKVADEAIKAGARIVNDVWGLRRDPDMARAVAYHGVQIVIMHNETSVDEQADAITRIRDGLSCSVDIALGAGIAAGNIILDPGIGFAKTFTQNLHAIARLGELTDMGFPILIGASRKSFIGHILGTDVHERLNGTLAAHLQAVLQGARIVRAHDVAAHVQALRVNDALMAQVT
jgi:dihydropteroate synthase